MFATGTWAPWNLLSCYDILNEDLAFLSKVCVYSVYLILWRKCITSFNYNVCCYCDFENGLNHPGLIQEENRLYLISRSVTFLSYHRHALGKTALIYAVHVQLNIVHLTNNSLSRMTFNKWICTPTWLLHAGNILSITK